MTKKIYCRECEKLLNFEQSRADENTIFIEPCQTCLDKIVAKSYEQGHEDGIQECDHD